MKHLKFLFTILALSLFATIYGQQTQKELEREKNKVQIFSDEERANLQLHFYDKTKEMNLSAEVEEDYYRLLLHYVYDMQRLNDKDKGNSDEEVKVQLEKIVSTMNSKIQPVLSKEQYQQHLNNFNDILERIYGRKGWEWTND
jgi:hypothetical protein